MTWLIAHWWTIGALVMAAVMVTLSIAGLAVVGDQSEEKAREWRIAHTEDEA